MELLEMPFRDAPIRSKRLKIARESHHVEGLFGVLSWESNSGVGIGGGYAEIPGTKIRKGSRHCNIDHQNSKISLKVLPAQHQRVEAL